jgi:hypothetical protein
MELRTLRGRLDFAVMGRYRRLQPAAEGLCSSRNQRLRLFSDRYTVADFCHVQTEGHAPIQAPAQLLAIQFSLGRSVFHGNSNYSRS